MAIPEYDISGRRIVLVGASRGIGHGVAEVLAEAGARIAIASLNHQSAEKAASGFRSRGADATAFAVDATKADDMTRFASDAVRTLGGIDVLVNCVGDSISRALVPRPGKDEPGMEEADWHNIVDINLTQAYTGCKAFGPHFLRQGRGVVINISGIAAFRPTATRAAYAASKSGVLGLTGAMALEWAPYGVRVNAIAPGTFPDAERIGAEAMAERNKLAATRVPLGRVGNLREVGLLALYLASDASAYVTGQTFCIDGGTSIA